MRTPLPTRRPSLLVQADWQGHPITIGASFYDSGEIGEVFADTPKQGQMQATLADACVLISISLQHGIPVSELRKSMAVEPDLMNGEDATRPASPVGAILDALHSINEIYLASPVDNG